METYHITQEGNRWLLREEGDPRVLIETASREAALEQTRDYLKLRTATVHTAEGTFSVRALSDALPLGA